MDPSTSSTVPLVRHEHDLSTGIHTIILDRPKQRNAISTRLLHELDECLNKVQLACAAPSPALEVLRWKQAQFREKKKQQSTQDDAINHSIASLDWPSPPMSRRTSTTVDHSSIASTSSIRSNSPSSPASLSSSITSLSTSTLPSSQPARCLIICSSSEEKAFCSGADLVERRSMSPEDIVGFLTKLRTVLEKLQNLPLPTIAAIDGPALGGGLELALCCDFRIASIKNKQKPLLGFPECQLGIIPGAGGTQRAARLIGVSRAKSLIFTGNLLNPIEAHSWGLIEFLTEEEDQNALESALRLAKKMQNSAPLALSAAKAAIDVGEEMDLQPGLDWEAACYHALLPTHDRKEALTAFAEKRKPEFYGR